MRLTDDRTAKALKEISDKLKAGGFEVDVSNERYIKLARYEQTGYEPEEVCRLDVKYYALDNKYEHIVKCKDCEFNYGLTSGEGFNPKDIVCSYFMTDGMEETDYCSNGKKYEEPPKEG